MIEEREGWFVVNVAAAQWLHSPSFGYRCKFDVDRPFTDVGINLTVLEPGKAACRYHRENAQEDFLVLAGEALLLVNGEKRALQTWDFVHCPPGVSHVFVGAGDRPCAILMIGHRRGDRHELFYPANAQAREYGAEAPEPTPDPRVAYGDVQRFEKTEAPRWPL